MGVYIKGMEMPKDGYVDVRIKYNGTAAHSTGEPPYFRVYDAIPVPPHGRLIDKDALLKDIDSNFIVKPDGDGNLVEVHGEEKVLAHIAYAPTIIPAEEGET